MGADDPFKLKMIASFRKIEPFSLAKLQLFQTFSSYYSIKHSKVTSKVPNLVEIEHFTVKKQLIASRSRQLGGVVNQFCGRVQNFARAHSALAPPFPEILYPPLGTKYRVDGNSMQVCW